MQEKLVLGNLDAKRDWGYAPEYTDGMWRMMQIDKADDFVLATNETHSVREFVKVAFQEVGLELKFFGKGAEEIGKEIKTGRILVSVDERYFRPAEVDLLIGNYAKAREQLKWIPQTTFNDLVKIMVDPDMKAIKNSKAT